MTSNWELDHVGFVVRDLDEVLAYYPSLGIGVNVGRGVSPVPGSPEEELPRTTLLVYGKPFVDRMSPPTAEWVSISRARGADLQVGSLALECIHGRPDDRVVNDYFFNNYGDGISHICFCVPDPEGETAELVKKGVEIVMSAERNGRIFENYLGTSKYGNIWLSLRPPADKWRKALQAHNRAHPLVSNWKFRGMGVATKDLDKAVEYYQFLGIDTPQPEVILDSSSSNDFKVHGLTGSVARARTKTARVGSVMYDFAQTLEDGTTFGECLSRRGEGVYSLDFTVDDLEKETARLTYRGIRVVLSGKDSGGHAFAYFDTREVGNLMVKLVEAT